MSRSLFRTVLLVLVSAALVRAQQPPTDPRPTVGIALEGGGALGLAHIGVLQWLEEHHVPIDRVSGTSMGALVGGLYAAGRSPEQIRQIAESDAFGSVFTLEAPYTSLSFRRRQDRRDMPRVVTIGLRSRYGLRNALLTDSGLNQFLERQFFNYNAAGIDFDRLPIPFRCVATDLTTLNAVTFRSGPLTQAVRASVSIPGIFSPVHGPNGDFLADGGIVDNLPVGVLRDELHATVAIAVHLETGQMTASDTGSILNVLNRAFAAGIALNEARSKQLADIVLNVPLGRYSTMDYGKGHELVQIGYQTAEAHRAELLRYALPDAEWQAYLDARAARQLPAPGALRAVHVQGGDTGAEEAVQHDMARLEGKPPTAATLARGLRNVQADGEYQATYTVEPNTPGDASVSGLTVHLTKEQGGPPYLVIGPEAYAASSNATRGEIDMRYIHQSFGGYGSELRATARLGYLTDLSAEYYRRLSPANYFVQPELRLLRQPVFLWQNQRRVSELFQQDLFAGVQAGRTLGNSIQVAAEWRGQRTRWESQMGPDGGPKIDGTAQTALLHLTVDKTSNSILSPRGMRLQLATGALYHAAASDTAPVVQIAFSRTRLLGQTNIFGVGFDLHSYLRARVAEPFRFTLGGPQRLSASSYDEYRGTDTALARAGYLHRLAALPTGMGQGLYAAIGYEAGEIWSPDRGAILRQDGLAGFVAATPVGVITFGGSVGDAGRRKVFITIGRWF